MSRGGGWMYNPLISLIGASWMCVFFKLEGKKRHYGTVGYGEVGYGEQQHI